MFFEKNLFLHPLSALGLVPVLDHFPDIDPRWQVLGAYRGDGTGDFLSADEPSARVVKLHVRAGERGPDVQGVAARVRVGDGDGKARVVGFVDAEEGFVRDFINAVSQIAGM